MPQLNPNPWLFMMLLSWLTFSIVLQPKLLSFTSTSLPSTKTSTAPKYPSWNWPWT